MALTYTAFGAVTRGAACDAHPYEKELEDARKEQKRAKERWEDHNSGKRLDPAAYNDFVVATRKVAELSRRAAGYATDAEAMETDPLLLAAAGQEQPDNALARAAGLDGLPEELAAAREEEKKARAQWEANKNDSTERALTAASKKFAALTFRAVEAGHAGSDGITWMPETGNHALASRLEAQLESEGFKPTFSSGNKSGDITYTYTKGNQKKYLIARRDGNHTIVEKYSQAHGKGLKDASPFDRDSDYGSAKIILREKQSGKTPEAIVKQYGFDLRFVNDVLSGKYGRSDAELKKALKDAAPELEELEEEEATTDANPSNKEIAAHLGLSTEELLMLLNSKPEKAGKLISRAVKELGKAAKDAAPGPAAVIQDTTLETAMGQDAVLKAALGDSVTDDMAVVLLSKGWKESSTTGSATIYKKGASMISVFADGRFNVYNYPATTPVASGAGLADLRRLSL